MEITPLGHASFKIKGKTATIVTDPFDPLMVGLPFPKNISADIVTVSHLHHDHDFVSGVGKTESGEQVVISGPGEYEIKGVEITGIDTWHDTTNGSERGHNTIYKIYQDGLVLVHLGDLGHKLTEIQEETLNDVNILFVPVGGFYSLDAKTAAEVVAQIEPDIIIPMHYNREKLNQKIFHQLAPLADFLKEMGKEVITPLEKYKITKDDLPEEPQIVVLE